MLPCARRPATLVVAFAAHACAGEDGSSGASDGGSSETSATSAAVTGATGVGADSSTGAPMGDGILQCTRTCEVPFDCCLPDMPGCPGAYPNNVACVDGFCRSVGCTSDADCTGQLAGQVCREVRGVPRCVTLCTDDTPCAIPGPGGACVGMTDDGETTCFTRCDAPGEFCGSTTCDPASGLCVCATSGVCQVDWECVD